MNPDDSDRKPSLFKRISSHLTGMAAFVSYGVWERTDDRWYIRPLKIISLSVRSFFDRDLQTQAYSLTYSTLLATVPVLAVIFAVAGGFGGGSFRGGGGHFGGGGASGHW